MFAMGDNPQPNPYEMQQWYQMQQQQQQANQEQVQQLQQQGFVKKKGCNCGKKKNISNQQNQG
ncbi:cytochrome C oxidase subunit III [Bacillus pseudomycoides]|uniref:Cytochrome C oxidase subunit III n=1 Tax=Bacillus pseudomycoides TaxID=64104 RepID=A0A2B5HAU6_9BACI|nr:cytochrome C oxidase subunit III [Bacillus pseudomycoides]PDY48797.1 cytochrome C oxidase subunit III [Bacillus pseudomycoides]PEA81299.1 cytochrome C oxidase subunit III [Bacillus pseudomycoides]PED05623.1 cytochrome C oxidase subunit III [Bacillus pseudomycoides]PED71695.1 cytochrome C oxidase subunit III [Bacillus pseudomycoides]PEI39866.1 cytochrome C oxidase subunit III [Bacillus pseudomycoides]